MVSTKYKHLEEKGVSARGMHRLLSVPQHPKSGLYLFLLFGVTMSYAQIRSPYAPRPVGVVNVLPRFLDPEDNVPSRLGNDKNSPSASTPSAVTLPASLKGSNVDTEMASRVNDWPDAHKPFWFVNAQHINRHVSQQPSANQFGKDTPRSGFLKPSA
uniref:(California timema) hypothetical protein n=1 Tax=Timema californicum TaxID=61474 RepID=A0A7R9J1R5_TIMCA|nr:unnamed protein product [Timema californicum]